MERSKKRYGDGVGILIKNQLMSSMTIKPVTAKNIYIFENKPKQQFKSHYHDLLWKTRKMHKQRRIKCSIQNCRNHQRILARRKISHITN